MRKPGKKPAATQSFTLVLLGISEITEELENALFAAGCDDALVGCRDGVVYLDFDREAESFRDAALSAIRDVRKAGALVARVEPDELVTAADIARRSSRSRQAINQYILGLRGPGGFPAPVAALKGRSPIWRWTEVADWLGANGMLRLPPDALPLEASDTIAALNDALDLVRRVGTLSAITELAGALVQD